MMRLSLRSLLGASTLKPFLPSRRNSNALAFVAMALSASSIYAQEALIPQRSPFLNWLLLFFGFAVIWFIPYKVLYPIFLKYYRPGYCKVLFWSIFFLYSLAWFHLSLYWLFEYGFFYFWIRWAAVFMAALWLIVTIAVAMTRRA